MQFPRAALDSLDLTQAYLLNADLTGANSDLDQLLTNANLTNANLTNANLYNHNADQRQLHGHHGGWGRLWLYLPHFLPGL